MRGWWGHCAMCLSKQGTPGNKKGAVSDLTRPQGGLAGTSEVQVPTAPALDHSGARGGVLEDPWEGGRSPRPRCPCEAARISLSVREARALCRQTR